MNKNVDNVKNKPTCIFILSEKSSGSSFLWRAINQKLGISQFPMTEHFENETLFWTKAASVLMMPQIDMSKSVVPYSKSKAEASLLKFLSDNLSENIDSDLDKDKIFEFWYQMILKFGPIYVEKSPHHLLQLSALELMLEFKERYCDKVNVQFVGLIRNPLSAVSSEVRRWGFSIEEAVEQWKYTYLNFIFLVKVLNSKDIFFVRFEDLKCNTDAELNSVLEKAGLSDSAAYDLLENVKSTKSDKSGFSFILDENAKYLAMKFGYLESELIGYSRVSSKIQYFIWRYVKAPLKIAIARFRNF